MIQRRTLITISLAASIGWPLWAQSAPPVPAPVAAPSTAPALPRVALVTGAGTIVIAIEAQRAPLTSANFLRYVREKRFDGTTFYRALAFPTAPDFGLIQGGVRGDAKRSLKPIAHEPTSATGLLHTDGTVSMARGTPGSATGDFFIVLGTIPSLDAQPGGDPGFAAFGHVVEGMDVVRQILHGPTSPTAGDGAMKGQILAAPVKIITARRVEP